MKRIVVAIPHSHTWFWTQTCLSSLQRNPPHVHGHQVDIIVVDNSPWSPAIKGVTDTALNDWMNEWAWTQASAAGVVPNSKQNKFHASALDHVVEHHNFDYLMALETDVMALRGDWLQWFIDQMKPTDFAVGMWHHEQFINPSCTLYRGDVLRDMLAWCKAKAEPNLMRWGHMFMEAQPLDERTCEPDVVNEYVKWVAGPFAEKRGWPLSTLLKETPSGQMKGPGWYEPGQQLHHWAVEQGWTYTVCPSFTTKVDGVPVQSLYGSTLPQEPQRQLWAAELFGNAATVHLWGGTRALDIIKHDVADQFIKDHTPIWLAREARFWREVVPQNVQEQTLELIRKHGWHITGQGHDHVTERDKQAAEYVRACYRCGGVEW